MSNNDKGGIGRIFWKVLGDAVLVGLGAVLLILTLGTPSQVLAQAASPVTHPTAGRENCTLCHNTSGPLVLPASHQGRTNQTCLLCHAAASAATATPVPAPTSAPTATATPAPTPTPQPTPVGATPGPSPSVVPSPTAAPTVPTPTPVQTSPTPTPTKTPAPAPQASPTPVLPASPSATCLMCHGTSSKLTLTLPSKETVSLAIQENAWHSSVHGSVLVCQDCHQGYEQLPHTSVAANSYREYSLAKYELCKKCHFANYTKSLDSVHYELLTTGHNEAPVCTDCHGAHNVQRPDQPRTFIPQTCSECHADIFNTYLNSVHGKALVDQQNQDVPTCTYCHGVHNIQDPRTSNYRLNIPELCGSCHSDKALMSKYGLSSNVLSSYLSDFHGTTVSMLSRKGGDATSYEAVCTDCHGIHNIVSAEDPSSPVIKANLVNTCRQCHTGASENFPSAWLSHYEPGFSHAPMVYLVKVMYTILIPFLVVGLSIQIVLNLWRSAINR